MRFRKLRIAWSVVCGLAAVLLCVLWVRSYWWLDVASGPRLSGRNCVLASVHGKVLFGSEPEDATSPWKLESTYIDDAAVWGVNGKKSYVPYSLRIFGRFAVSDGVVYLPYWFVSSVISVIISSPWLPLRRFSLRTLLIAMTLVAVVLGLVVWLR